MFNMERIYFFFLAGAFFLAAFFLAGAFLAGAFFLAAFLAGAFFLAAFLAGAFFFAVANSLTSFQVFFETTSISLITAKCKTLSASYAPLTRKFNPFLFMTHASHSSRKSTSFIATCFPNRCSSYTVNLIGPFTDYVNPFHEEHCSIPASIHTFIFLFET